MSYYSAKDIQEAIDKVESIYKDIYKKQYIMFAYSEEHKEMLEKYFPNDDIRVLPQCCKTEENKDKVYVMPIPNYEPIKFVELGDD